MPGKTSTRRSKSAPPKFRPWQGISRNRLRPLEPYSPPQSPPFVVRAMASFQPLRPYRTVITALVLILAVYVVVELPARTQKRWVIDLVCNVLGGATSILLYGLWTEMGLPPAPHPHSVGRDGTHAVGVGGARQGAVRRRHGPGGDSSRRYCHSGSQTDGPWGL